LQFKLYSLSWQQLQLIDATGICQQMRRCYDRANKKNEKSAPKTLCVGLSDWGSNDVDEIVEEEVEHLDQGEFLGWLGRAADGGDEEAQVGVSKVIHCISVNYLLF
jgi:hypothetical protein